MCIYLLICVYEYGYGYMNINNKFLKFHINFFYNTEF